MIMTSFKLIDTIQFISSISYQALVNNILITVRKTHNLISKFCNTVTFEFRTI